MNDEEHNSDSLKTNLIRNKQPYQAEKLPKASTSHNLSSFYEKTAAKQLQNKQL